jgi:hypothetical protein
MLTTAADLVDVLGDLFGFVLAPFADRARDSSG